MSYELIAIDIDGTLLDNEHNIPDVNRKALEKLKKTGKHIVLCSGRSHMSANLVAKNLGLINDNIYGISYHGAVIYNSSTLDILNEYYLDAEIGHLILNNIKQFSNSIVVYANGKVYVEHETDNTKAYEKQSGLKHTVLKDFSEIEGNFTKILAKGTPEELVKIEKHIRPIVKDKCTVIYSERTLIEFTDLVSNKGVALKILCEKLNVPIEKVIAIGDNFNDASMIKIAGLGVAVNNAVDEIKSMADYVTENNNTNGAVAEVIEKFML